MLRVALMSLGCRANQAELSGIRNRLHALVDDLQEVGWDETADVYVLNSCTVTARADRQGRQQIHRAYRRGGGAPVVVCGCYAEAAAQDLATIPGVAAIVGNAHKDEAAALAVDLGRGHRQGTPFGPARHIADRIERSAAVSCPVDDGDRGRVRAALKIQEGCDRRCRYCIVPLVRGPERSVPADEVVRQARVLADHGHPEIVITGIHTGRWGRGEPGSTLSGLLRRLIDEVDGPRFRLSSMDPDEVDEELITLIGRQRRLCRHLHLSIQHLSPDVLGAMGRSKDADATLALLDRLVDRVHGIALGADVLVGFPGESDPSFTTLLDALSTSPLTYLHVFGFSRRRGTAAWSMPDQVPSAVVEQRVGILRQLSETTMRAAALDDLIGRDVEVAVERSTRLMLRGTSSEFATVELKR